MLTDFTVNGMADAKIPAGAGNVLMSAHSAYSLTGANLLGLKTSANFAAAVGRVKSLAANCNINIGAGSVVRWLGIWDAAGTNFLGMETNGSTGNFAFQIDVANNRIYIE